MKHDFPGVGIVLLGCHVWCFKHYTLVVAALWHTVAKKKKENKKTIKNSALVTVLAAK